MSIFTPYKDYPDPSYNKWRRDVCDICKRKRRREHITASVYSLEKTYRGAVRNIEYCNDSESCYKEVMKKATAQIV